MYASIKRTDVTDQNSAFFFVPAKSYSFLSISEIIVDSLTTPASNPNLGMKTNHYFITKFYF